MRKCNSHLQYYKIDLSFSIKLRMINLNESEDYKTERIARRSNRARDKNVPTKPADFLTFPDLFQNEINVDCQ